MVCGFAIIAFQTLGETTYSMYFKTKRSKEIMVEKKQGEIETDEDEAGVIQQLNPLNSRKAYKEQRLKKIKEAREKAIDEQPAALTVEELNSKPTKKEIKMRPLVQRDEKVQLERDNKDNYM